MIISYCSGVVETRWRITSRQNHARLTEASGSETEQRHYVEGLAVVVLMTYALQGGQGGGGDQQQNKGQGLAQSQLPTDTVRNKHS